MLKDITIQHGDFGTVQPEIIHISVKGKSLGTGSFLGMLLRHIEKEKGTDSGMAAFSLAMLADKYKNSNNNIAARHMFRISGVETKKYELSERPVTLNL